jgi:hypothetical protein
MMTRTRTRRLRTRDADRRAAGLARWRRWAARERAGRGSGRFEYDRGTLNRLIAAGWLEYRPDHAPTPDEIDRAVSDFLLHGDLPKKKV